MAVVYIQFDYLMESDSEMDVPEQYGPLGLGNCDYIERLRLGHIHFDYLTEPDSEMGVHTQYGPFGLGTVTISRDSE
jgi:hypothetical protein